MKMLQPQNTHFEKWVLFFVLLLAFVIRYLGVSFGLPHLYHADEPIVVNHALAYGTGDLNPHFFNIPPLVSYLLFVCYGIYYLAGHLIGWFPNTRDFEILFYFDPTSFYLIARVIFGTMLGTLSVFLLHRLARRLGNERMALLAAVFLAVNFLHARDSLCLRGYTASNSSSWPECPSFCASRRRRISLINPSARWVCDKKHGFMAHSRRRHDRPRGGGQIQWAIPAYPLRLDLHPRSSRRTMAPGMVRCGVCGDRDLHPPESVLDPGSGVLPGRIARTIRCESGRTVAAASFPVFADRRLYLDRACSGDGRNNPWPFFKGYKKAGRFRVHLRLLCGSLSMGSPTTATFFR